MVTPGYSRTVLRKGGRGDGNQTHMGPPKRGGELVRKSTVRGEVEVCAARGTSNLWWRGL